MSYMFFFIIIVKRYVDRLVNEAYSKIMCDLTGTCCIPEGNEINGPRRHGR